MSEIPSWFWMVIIAGLSAMLGMILFYLGMLLRESMLTVKELRFMMVEMKVIFEQAKVALDKVNGMLAVIEGAINRVGDFISKPFQAIAGIFGGLKEKFGLDDDDDPPDPREYFEPSTPEASTSQAED